MCIETQVHADTSGRPGKVEVSRVQDLSHFSDPVFVPWIIIQGYKVCLCDPENLRVLHLPHRAASCHNHQTVEHGVPCRSEWGIKISMMECKEKGKKPCSMLVKTRYNKTLNSSFRFGGTPLKGNPQPAKSQPSLRPSFNVLCSFCPLL